MSDLLSIGLSGVTAYRSALAAVGENVANAETPGFTRRSVVLRQASAGSPQPDMLYREGMTFGGVSAASVQRAWDSFRATEARTATSAASRSAVRERWLTAVENGLDNGPAGVGASLTAFYAAATNLAADPGDRLRRSNMLSALDTVSSAFRSSADALGRIAGGVADAARIDAGQVLSALQSLHDLNATMRVAAPGTSARAAMEDERDRLIESISERLDVDVAIAGNGTASLTAAGGVVLLDMAGSAWVEATAAADGRITLDVTKDGTTTSLVPRGGSLAGLVETAAAVAERRSGLDALAADFVASVNSWSAGGRGLAGDPGDPLLEMAGGAATVRAIPTDPARLPAASADGRANGNLLALDGLRTTGSFEGRWNGIVGANAQSLNAVRSEARASASWRDQARASLDEVVGIDLNREAADMLRFQQAYSGAARILQVARETLQDILNLF